MTSFPPPTGPIEVALAKTVEAIPDPDEMRGGCVYEIKIDGWRMTALTKPDGVELWSRHGSDLSASFPEVVEAVSQSVPSGCCLDGEVTIWRDGRIEWSQLQTRMGVARAAAQARTAPASYLVFDLLAVEAQDIRPLPWSERRSRLEDLARDWAAPLELVPYTTDKMEAEASAADYAPFGIEGLVIKGRATPYRPGRRDWQKWKLRSSSEAIVGAVIGPIERPESLVLGRVGDDGVLVIVARSVALHQDQSAELAALLEPMRPDRHPWPEQISGGFFGGRTVELTHVVPNRVVEISADAARLGSRYRHSVRYLRWRADLTVEDVPTSSELG